MALPLQIDLRPRPAWQRSAAIITALVLAVGVVGWCGRARAVPPVLLLSGPGHEAEYARAVERLVAGARARVWVLMFVIRADPDSPVMGLMEALAAAKGRGVDVRVALDRGLTYDTKESEHKHEAPAAWLRDHGVPVLLDELARTSHAKVVLVDGRWAVVGSHNWTRSALVANRETSLLLDDPRIVSQLEGELAAMPGWGGLTGPEVRESGSPEVDGPVLPAQ